MYISRKGIKPLLNGLKCHSMYILRVRIKPLLNGLKCHSMYISRIRIKPLVNGLKCHSMYISRKGIKPKWNINARSRSRGIPRRSPIQVGRVVGFLFYFIFRGIFSSFLLFDPLLECISAVGPKVTRNCCPK